MRIAPKTVVACARRTLTARVGLCDPDRVSAERRAHRRCCVKAARAVAHSVATVSGAPISTPAGTPARNDLMHLAVELLAIDAGKAVRGSFRDGEWLLSRMLSGVRSCPAESGQRD